MRRAAHALYRVKTGDSRGAIMMTSTTTTERVNTVVIGGGQTGLSVGYHLARRGVPFVILDANARTGDTWRRRWDSLRLFTPAKFAGLDGLPFPAAPNSFPTKDEMADYLEAVRSNVRAARAGRRSRHPPFPPGRSAGRGCRRSAFRRAERGRRHDELSAAARSAFRS